MHVGRILQNPTVRLFSCMDYRIVHKMKLNNFNNDGRVSDSDGFDEKKKFKDSLDEWEEYYKHTEDRLLDSDKKNYRSVRIITPSITPFRQLVKKLKSGRGARATEAAIFGFGLRKFYNKLKTENIIVLLDLVEEINDIFLSQELKNYPKFNIESIMGRERVNKEIFTHVDDKQQSAILEEEAERLGLSSGDFAFITHIYTFNAFFIYITLSNEHQHYYADNGYVSDINIAIKKYRRDLEEYIGYIHPYLENAFKMEGFRVAERLADNDNLLLEMSRVIKLVENFRFGLRE